MNAQIALLTVPFELETFRRARSQYPQAKKAFSLSLRNADRVRLGSLTMMMAAAVALFGGFLGMFNVVEGNVGFLGFLIGFAAFVPGMVMKNVTTYRRLFRTRHA
ncbi:MAG: hypothetical protein ACT4TC_16775 [Myxococcaceae bacterium]